MTWANTAVAPRSMPAIPPTCTRRSPPAGIVLAAIPTPVAESATVACATVNPEASAAEKYPWMSIFASTEPTALYTLSRPSAPTGMIAVFVTGATSLSKLTTAAAGRDCPDGQRCSVPGVVTDADVTVTSTTTAVTPLDGTPVRPATGNDRVTAGPMGAEIPVPSPVTVSKSLAEGSGTNAAAAPGSSAAAESIRDPLAVRIESITSAPTTAVARTKVGHRRPCGRRRRSSVRPRTIDPNCKIPPRGRGAEPVSTAVTPARLYSRRMANTVTFEQGSLCQ